MLVVLVRTIVIFLFLLLGLRLMGKRQIGELQPFEFVITLTVADLACMPMQDVSLPIIYGLAPVLVVFVVHYFVTFISNRSIKFRKFLNGKPMIVINNAGIDIDALRRLNMNVNDLLESIRGQNYFSIQQISFALVETNGNLSVLPNPKVSPPTTIPLTLIMEGKFLDANINISNTNKAELTEYLKSKHLNMKNVVLLTTESGKVFLQPRRQSFIVEELKK